MGGNNKRSQVRFSPEIGRTILDMASENPNIVGITRALGNLGTKTIFWWLHSSQQEKLAYDAGTLQREPRFLIRWPSETEDGEKIFFHEAMKLAMKMFSITADWLNQSEVVFGHRKVLRNPSTGHVMYEIDHDAVQLVGVDNPFSKEAKELADLHGIHDFPFAHDKFGKRIKMTENMPVAAALKIHSLRRINPAYDLVDRSETRTEQQHVLVLRPDAPPPVARPQTPLVEDLRTRLDAMRAAKDGERVTKPDAPVRIEGRGGDGGDPPERQTGAPAPAALADHPRAYQAPTPAPKPKPPAVPAYARPDVTRGYRTA